MIEPKLRTISDVEREFEEKFVEISEDKTLWSWRKDASVGQVRFFLAQSLRELLEQVVPEEKDLGWETITERDKEIKIEERVWNAYRQKIKEIIKEILK